MLVVVGVGLPAWLAELAELASVLELASEDVGGPRRGLRPRPQLDAERRPNAELACLCRTRAPGLQPNVRAAPV